MSPCDSYKYLPKPTFYKILLYCLSLTLWHCFLTSQLLHLQSSPSAEISVTYTTPECIQLCSSQSQTSTGKGIGRDLQTLRTLELEGTVAFIKSLQLRILRLHERVYLVAGSQWISRYQGIRVSPEHL